MSDFNGRSTYSMTGTIQNNGFFPDLDLSEFQKEWRVANDYRQESVETHLLNAILEINRQLKSFQAENLGAGTLDNVTQDTLGQTKALVHQYKRAVYSHAKAYLLREFATINRREKAENLAKESEESHDALLEQSNLAVRYIQNRPVIGVDAL